MLLNKYCKSNMFFIVIIFLVTFIDVYGDYYWLSATSVLMKDVFWSHFFVYVIIYLFFIFFIDFIIFLFKKFFRNNK
ncbi:hypothetical protein BKL49_09740 [Rodentibacter myodis]|uniref:Uncharacterized protein n=1 Tax=Rodentibacter myodis TaxID=1907939 RepID=A0A1V3JL35_9PAST|nr:hypothetical protein BKL49_09740 [Rodentibacter myodis]